GVISLTRTRLSVRHARPKPAAHALPSALPIQGLRARDRRRLLHFDRIVGSTVRSLGHREAAGGPGRAKRRAPGVLKYLRTRSGGAPVPPRKRRAAGAPMLRPEQATIPQGHSW